VYQVTLFKGKDTNEYTMMDIRKPLNKDLVRKIMASVYKYKNKKFDAREFDLYYTYGVRVKELQNALYDTLKKIDTSLDFIAISEILDINNKDEWFYIANYTDNKKVSNLFDELSSLPNVKFDDYGFDVTLLGYSFYTNLSRMLGGDKNASLFLLKNGIDGLKRDIDKERTDYIIFDEDSISIDNTPTPI
jgi:hypothetical protein